MLKFSFLIPVYNGAKYLDRLFRGLLEQDVPLSDYEIVFVDDCSSDNSVEIIKRYQRQFPNVRLLLNERNCRLATNVNKLVSNAQGKFFWLIGQDDFVENNCLGLLWERLESEMLDVLLFNYKRIRDDETLLNECKVFETCPRMSGIEYIDSQFKDRDYTQYVLGYEWRAVYRTAYWKEKGIRCVDGMNYEDTVIMLKAMVYSQAVASLSDSLYYYRVNEGSITYSENFNKRGDLIYEFSFMVGDEVEAFYNDLKKINAALASNLYEHLIKRYNCFAFDLIRTSVGYKRDFFAKVSENKGFVSSKRQWLSWGSKLLLLPFMGFYLSCMCAMIYKMKKRLFE